MNEAGCRGEEVGQVVEQLLSALCSQSRDFAIHGEFFLVNCKKKTWEVRFITGIEKASYHHIYFKPLNPVIF